MPKVFLFIRTGPPTGTEWTDIQLAQLSAVHFFSVSAMDSFHVAHNLAATYISYLHSLMVSTQELSLTHFFPLLLKWSCRLCCPSVLPLAWCIILPFIMSIRNNFVKSGHVPTMSISILKKPTLDTLVISDCQLVSLLPVSFLSVLSFKIFISLP